MVEARDERRGDTIESECGGGLSVTGGKNRAERRHGVMMLRGSAQPVALIAAGNRSVGEVRIERWTPAARLRRAAKRWTVLWALAALSVLIPVAHFVLVPALLIAGPISAVARYRQRSGVIAGEGVCPSCGARFIIEAREDTWPFFAPCEACHEVARIEKIAGARPGMGPTPVT